MEFRQAHVAVFGAAEYLALNDDSSVVSGKAGLRWRSERRDWDGMKRRAFEIAARGRGTNKASVECSAGSRFTDFQAL